MRLGPGPSGATVESLHTVRRVAPISGEHLIWSNAGLAAVAQHLGDHVWRVPGSIAAYPQQNQPVFDPF
jgi:hypothetical protein